MQAIYAMRIKKNIFSFFCCYHLICFYSIKLWTLSLSFNGWISEFAYFTVLAPKNGRVWHAWEVFVLRDQKRGRRHNRDDISVSRYTMRSQRHLNELSNWPSYTVHAWTTPPFSSPSNFPSRRHRVVIEVKWSVVMWQAYERRWNEQSAISQLEALLIVDLGRQHGVVRSVSGWCRERGGKKIKDSIGSLADLDFRVTVIEAESNRCCVLLSHVSKVF